MAVLSRMSEKEESQNPVDFIVLQSERKSFQVPPGQDVFFRKAELINIQPDSSEKSVILSVDYEIEYVKSDCDDSEEISDGKIKKATDHLEIELPISSEKNEKVIHLQFCQDMNPVFHVSGPADVKLTGFTLPETIENEEESENDDDDKNNNNENDDEKEKENENDESEKK